jgi:hypothetical protein
MQASGRLLSVLVLLHAAPVLASSPDDPPECKECRHLCYLMDQMQQHEAIAQLYWTYASQNPARQSIPDTPAMMHQIADIQFSAWSNSRTWPCGVPAKRATKTEVDLTTTDSTEKPPCTIYFGNDELYKGDTLARFTKDKCNDVTAPTIKHEEKHQQDCKLAVAMHQSIYDNPAAQAQTEFDANSLHAQALRQSIRDLINSTSDGCGWKPTEGQKNNPNSIPSTKQMQDMHARDEKLRTLFNFFPFP